MLNRIRTLKRTERMSEDDRLTLEKCHQRYLNQEYHPEALHLFAKNAKVDLHNAMMIEKVCTDIRTFHEVDKTNAEIKCDESITRGRKTNSLRLAKNARVMITKNLCVSDGLANGVVGRIVDFIAHEDKDVYRVQIKCDSARVGQLHRISCPYCRGRDTVCVGRESINDDCQGPHAQTKKGYKQFPLRLSWAMTIHKAQRITVDEIVVHTKDLFGTGMGYAALSRVRSLEGLFLVDFYPNKFYCDERVERVLQMMTKMKTTAPVFQDRSKCLNVLFHNIEGLRTNFCALKNHHCTKRATLICLVETWLPNDASSAHVQLDGYRLIHKTRSSSFTPDHPLRTQQHGSVAIYAQEHLSLDHTCDDEQPDLEYVQVDLAETDLTIITCYRSPQQKKREFTEKVAKLLARLDPKRKILLVGDLNEDSRSVKENFIEKNMTQLGFHNLYRDVPTTNGLTCVDCAYVNFAIGDKTRRDVVGTYYSYHDALTFSIDVLDNNGRDGGAIVMEIGDIADGNPSDDSLMLGCEHKHEHRWNASHLSRLSREPTPTSSVISPTATGNGEKQQRYFVDVSTHRLHESAGNDASTRVDQTVQLPIGGLRKKPIPADGNCFFRAVSHQLYGHQNEHLNIRASVINYLTDTMNDYLPYLDERYPTADEYIDYMSRNATYADHLAVLATAKVIHKNIIVHQVAHTPLLIPGNDLIDYQIHVWYSPDNEHYDSTTLVNAPSSFVDVEDVRIT